MNAARQPIRSVLFICAAILGLGILPLPDTFYDGLRLVATCAFAYCAWASFNAKAWTSLALTLALAILFSPFVPLRLSRDIWACLDGAAAAYLAVLAKHADTGFATYAPPERDFGSLAHVLGFAVLGSLIAGMAVTVLVGVVDAPLKGLGFWVSGKFMNPLAYGIACATAVGVIAGYAYDSGAKAAVVSEA